ncbi:MAG: UDP-N-acetylmuramate--L-alanine ligase [Thermodesulfovibrionia bacterium]
MNIFFSGIAGSGLSAIACFMRDNGHTVSGSDRLFDISPEHPLKRQFQSMDIDVFPQDGSGINGLIDLLIFSTAVEDGHPELLKAKGLGIRIRNRPEYLIELSSRYKTIAIAGTSGKSTTSGLLAFLMSQIGLRPNLICGGRVRQFISERGLGNHLTGGSDHLIIEACESDGTIIHYKPQHTIILNLSLDHHPISETRWMFSKLIDNTRGMVFLNADDKDLMEIKNDNSITFSIHSHSDYRIGEVIYKPFSTEFVLNGIGFELPIPGEHNLYNAISCIAFLSEMGIPMSDLAMVLNGFKGIHRRFDIHLNTENGLVIDDYAHNPHKILYLMKTMSRIKDSICYIFQPHGFAPTRFMKDEYIRVFIDNLRDSDHLILLPIYYTGGTVSRDISSHDLAREIMAGGRSVEVIEDRLEIFSLLNKWQNYVVFGARDDSLSTLAKEIAERLQGNSKVDAGKGKVAR